MKFLLTLACIGAIMPTAVSSAESDESLKQKIVGVWYSEDNIGPQYFYGEKNYEADGTASGFIDTWVNGARERTIFRSKWQIKDGKLISTVLFSSSPELLATGEEIADKIVSIEKDKMILISNGGEGHELVRYRKPTR